MTCLVTLFDRKLQVFQKLAKTDHFWYFFIELLFTQNVNVARFARNLELDFDFQAMCLRVKKKIGFDSVLLPPEKARNSVGK